MARACIVCTHADRSAIDLALGQKQTPVAVLAANHGFTRDQLNWHWRRHTQAKPAELAQEPFPLPSPQSRAVAQTGARDRARERFLKVYAQCGNVSTAAKASGVGRNTIYRWQEHVPGFAEAMRECDLQATELLEQEAWRRARDGFAEPVYQHGKLVGTVQRYSDALLVFLLKARAPERYRDRIDMTVTPVIKAVAGFDPAEVV